jgi:hypothetical protein
MTLPVIAIHHTCYLKDVPPLRPEHASDPYVQFHRGRWVLRLWLLTTRGWRLVRRTMPIGTTREKIRALWFDFKGWLSLEQPEYRIILNAVCRLHDRLEKQHLSQVL